MNDDDDELQWKQFLGRKTPQPRSLFNSLPRDRLEDSVRHVRISEAMQCLSTVNRDITLGKLTQLRTPIAKVFFGY